MSPARGQIPQGCSASAIHGVWSAALRCIPAPGGPVLHMLRVDSPWFVRFGEMYFSEIEPGRVKGWKRHREQTQCFAVPVGQVEFVLYDGRSGSPTLGTVEKILLGRPDNYRLLRVPPGIWYAFAGTGETPGLIANLADIPHAPEESERLPLDTPCIPYCWQP